jgi:dienelactone hydrolase
MVRPSARLFAILHVVKFLPIGSFATAIGLWSIASVASMLPSAAGAEPIEHAHQRLDYFVDAAGNPAPIRTPDDWQRRRATILDGMQAVMGPLPAEMRRGTPDAPAPAPLDVRTIETTEQEGVPRQTISIASRNGERVTAYVWWPPRTSIENHAAILALHPTGDIGKGICAGYGKANRGYGIELARRGYVVIAPDYVSFGDQKDHDFAKDDYESGTMKAIVDHMRCVDYLQSRDDVDPDRIGVIGHSLGGHNSLFVAAFDPRIKAIVSSCGWDPFHHYYGGKKLANWAQERYMPRVVSEFGADPDRMPFDFYEVVAAMAPRPFFTNSPLGDGNFEYKGVKKGVREARKIYALLGAADKLQARYPNCAHDFPDQQRREAYAFLDDALKHKPTSRIPDWNVGTRKLVEVKSTADGSMQPSYLSVPEGYDPQGAAVPLLVNVHSWSGDLTQRAGELETAANARGWIFLAPNFRGPNNKPEACGSKLAQQDVLDAVEWAAANYRVDRKRIYLTGSSGGGHMTMLLAGTHPEVWAAASAWVGISDLAAWHRKHEKVRYGAMLRQVCGGAPGASAEVDEQYRLRSPLTHLAGAKDLPLDLAAGIYDGHAGSVPVRHTLEAFNVVAKANGDGPSGEGPIDEAMIGKLGSADWPAAAPTADDEPHDPTYDRTIYFRRTSGKCRVTLFEGGHERVDTAAIQFLERHVKP